MNFLPTEGDDGNVDLTRAEEVTNVSKTLVFNAKDSVAIRLIKEAMMKKY